jgi:hypothetical protein
VHHNADDLASVLEDQNFAPDSLGICEPGGCEANELLDLLLEVTLGTSALESSKLTGVGSQQPA